MRMKQALDRQAGLIAEIAEVLIRAFRSGNKVILFGNGGSAADAQHLAAELVGKYYLRRPGLPAIALGANVCSLTAIGNDFSFDKVFVLQLAALARPGDVAVGISTSGRSRNVLAALRVARHRGLVTVGLCGAASDRMRPLVDICLSVPSRDTPRVQETHILAGHIVCELVEHELFGQGRQLEVKR
jgi:D-sedoheptulose 7-phosphate isomerase